MDSKLTYLKYSIIQFMSNKIIIRQIYKLFKLFKLLK